MSLIIVFLAVMIHSQIFVYLHMHSTCTNKTWNSGNSNELCKSLCCL